MDLDLARTFLEVALHGSFMAAADRLHLTQTAISARIRTLEDQLGRCLFVRNKAGARLTPAGERFVRHATTLIQVWERARHQVALPPGRQDGVSLGAELSIWHPLMADWLVWMKLVPAGRAAQVGRYLGYYRPYATSHDDLDADTALQQEVRNAAESLLETVGRLRRGECLPSPADSRNPRPK